MITKIKLREHIFMLTWLTGGPKNKVCKAQNTPKNYSNNLLLIF
jgi:hypothetical protein